MSLDGKNKEIVYDVPREKQVSDLFSIYNDTLLFVWNNCEIGLISLHNKEARTYEKILTDVGIHYVKNLVPVDNSIFFIGLVYIDHSYLLGFGPNNYYLFRLDLETNILTKMLNEPISGITYDKENLYVSVDEGVLKISFSGEDQIQEFVFEGYHGVIEIAGDYLFFQAREDSYSYYKKRINPPEEGYEKIGL
jgi:hypothetical protein